MAMNPWLGASLMEERVRDLRAVAGRARAGRRSRGRAATTSGAGATPGRVGRPSLAHRAARALTGQRLRPA